MSDNDSKPMCKYGAKCYQKNETHLNRFSHPVKEDEQKNVSPNAATRKRGISPKATVDSRKKLRSDTSPTASISPNGNSNGKGFGESSTRVTRSSSMSPKTKVSPKTSPKVSPKASPKLSPEAERKKTSPVRSPKALKPSETSPSVPAPSSSTRLNHGPSQKHDIDFINDVFDKETRFSQRAEYKELLKTPSLFIKNKFLTEMPNDFYALWDFCKEVVKSPQKPETVFEKFGLQLVGPYDVLAGKFNEAEMFEPGDYLRHWRFFYDPPEFQTILVKSNTTLHYGYWRDNTDNNCLIARNDVAKGCEITHVGDNIISAVIHFLEKDAQLTPFTKTAATAMKKSLEEFAQRNNISLNSYPAKIKARNVRSVCKTFHKAGLVVPFDRKTSVGYRQLIESDANLKKILDRFSNADGDEDIISGAMEKLQPLITAASIAVDECDFGNSIELGIDLFCHGASELHNVLLQLLVNGYSMVNKPQFIAIIKAHLDDRKKGNDLSILKDSTSSNTA